MAASSLDRQIAADPANPDPYLVLADALLATGDRHGELIVLQSQKRSAKVVKREAELLKELAPQLFGDLAKIATRRVKKGTRGPLPRVGHGLSLNLPDVAGAEPREEALQDSHARHQWKPKDDYLLDD